MENKTKLFCIRCIRGIVTDRKLDNFVKKQHGGIIPPIPTPIISKRNQIRLDKGYII